MTDAARSRLPVPAPWQPAVELALEQLCARQGLPREAVAPTRVRESGWKDDPGGAIEEGLEILLLAQGKTYRFRATLDDARAPRVFAADA